jgi:hypothetical protein
MLDSKGLNEVRRTAHYTDFSRRVKDFRRFPAPGQRRRDVSARSAAVGAHLLPPPLRAPLLLQLDAARADA